MSREPAVRPAQVAPVRAAPEPEEADHHEDVGGAVEDAIPARVAFQVLDGGDRVPAAQHVIPLQHLMQDDAIEEPAEPEAEQHAGGEGKPRR